MAELIFSFFVLAIIKAKPPKKAIRTSLGILMFIGTILMSRTLYCFGDIKVKDEKRESEKN